MGWWVSSVVGWGDGLWVGLVGWACLWVGRLIGVVDVQVGGLCWETKRDLQRIWKARNSEVRDPSPYLSTFLKDSNGIGDQVLQPRKLSGHYLQSSDPTWNVHYEVSRWRATHFPFLLVLN